MARLVKSAFRLLVAATVGLGGWAAWVSAVGTPAATAVLPAGAAGVVEVRDADGVVARLSGTRFATAFAGSASAAWLERTEIVRSFDALLAEVRKVTHVALGRSSALDLLGSEAAAAWYPAEGGPAAEPPWVVGCRLSLRAWAVAGALQLVDRAVGTPGVVRSETAGRSVYHVPTSSGEVLHFFFAGRLLVLGSDHARVERAAAASRGDDAESMAADAGLRALRAELPAQGELFVWSRGRLPIPGPLAGAAGGGAAVCRVAGTTVEVDAVSEPPLPAFFGSGGGADAPALPALGLLSLRPLALLSSRQPPPDALVDLLRGRQRLAHARGRDAGPEPPLTPGRGFALALTGSDPGTGLFPTPRGLVSVGMSGEPEARAALPLLFPAGARRGTAGPAAAYASRESIPLAGDVDLWGAALGANLVFATDPGLIAAAAGAPAPAAGAGDTPPWRVETFASLSVEQALPLLRRWSGPLSGLVSARWPSAPDISRDLDLLGAVRTVRATLGSDGKRNRALLTLAVRDLP